MPVLYSTAMPLNRGGMGTIAWHACHALQEAGLLSRVLAPETGAAGPLAPQAVELPWFFQKAAGAMNRFGWHYWKDTFFDRWASCWLEPGMDYYGWLHQSLACIRKCHRGGGKTWVDRGSVEPRLQQRWLAEEYSRHGIRGDPIPPLMVQRMVDEAEETDGIAAASTLVAQSYLAAGYDASRLRVNLLGVELGPSFDGERSDDLFRLVFVGQLSVQKGIPDLLKAWRALAPEKAELVLAGVIPQREEHVIRPLLEECRHVKWNGHCADVPALLRTSDVLVLPSAQDGFGMVVLEAFASGLPVIVSDRVGAKDCVTEGKNGLVFQFGCQRMLEERLEWFLKDPWRARSMRAAAREAAARYSWENYGKRFVALFQTAA